MSSPSDMSDDHSQPSDEDDHQTDSDSQSSQRADVEEFFDNSAQEQSGSEVSSRASDVDEEGRDEQFDGLSDSGSDLDANIENMNRHQRRRLLDSGGLPGGPNGMFGRRSILDDMAEEDFFAEHGSEASDDTDLDQMWGFDRSGKHRPRDKTQYTFTQFKRLPLELRERIWESFCPDLAVKGRFYEFKLISSSRDYRYGPAAAPEVWEGAVLAQQTETARRVLSVHKESRNFALRSFPHELHLRAGRGIVRFHSHRDVIYIEKASRFDVQNHIPMPVLPNFSDRVRHVGLDPDLWYYLDPALEGFLTAFPNLQHAYFVTEYSWPRPKDMLWCADGQNVNHYYLDSYEVTMGIAADVTYRWAWPNLTTQAGKEFAEKFIDPVKIGKDDNRGNYAKKAWDAGLEVWPLVGFPQDHGDWAFQKLLDWAKKGETDVKWPDEDDEDDDDESSEEADEYESSGIDDGSLAESEEESEDDLAVVDGSDTDRDDDDSDEDGLEAPALMHGEEFAGFSSPEPESGDETSSSATVREASDHDSASEHPSSPPPKSKLKRPRGRVLDSDDEEEEDISHKRARTDATTRRMRPSTSDSEDSHQNQEEKEDDSENEDSAPQFRRAKESSRRRRKRRSISDSDDDDDNADDTDSEDASPQVAPKRKRARTSTKLIVESDDDSSEEERKMRKNALLVHPEIEEDEEESGSDGHSRSESDQEDSDEDDSEDEDEDDDKPSRPLTLAEKLALHREKYPIPSDDDGDEEAKDTDEDGGVNVDAEPMGGTDYDARDYADFQDDEEGYEHEIEEEERADRNDAKYFDDSVEYDDNDGEGEW